VLEGAHHHINHCNCLQAMRHTLSSLKIEEGALVQSLEEKKNILSNYSRDKEMLKGKHDRVARQVGRNGGWM